MTQAITEISNNLYTMLQQPDSTDASSYMSKQDNFTSIIEKNQKILEEQPSTIGDIKNREAADIGSLANFRKFLLKETKKSNTENSLDLTLAEDIKNFIVQFQAQNSESATSTTNTETSENIPVPAELQKILSILNITDDNIELYKKLADKLATLENTAMNSTELLSSMNELVQNETLSENPVDTNLLSKKLTEAFSKIVNNTSVKPETNTTINEPEISDEMLQELHVESIEATTDSDYQGEYDLQQQTPEEHIIKAMLLETNTDFENNISETSANTEITDNELKENPSSKIMEQVTKQLNGIKPNSKVDIILNPEKLGKVSIQVSKSAEGMSAQFTVSTNEAKEILLKNIDGLKETLLSHGISSDNISVKMNETQKGEYKQDWTEQDNSGNKNKEQYNQQKENKEEKNFEKMIAFINEEEIENK